MATKKKKSEVTVEDRTCSFCKKVSPTQLNVCKGCLKVRYCNINCQRNHWKSGHRQECKQSASDQSKIIQEVLKTASLTPEDKLASAAKNILKDEITNEVQILTEEEVVDETGIDKNLLDILVQFTGCTRSLGVKALRARNNDIVNSIMAVTPGYKNQIDL